MAKTEMERALEADGEKLRTMTGEDHGPWQIFTCEACDGKGYTAHRITVYEHGCGFPHDDTEERQCPECSGYGEFTGPCEADAVPARPRWQPPLIDCPVCGGSGFSGQGSGYGDVCDECGGTKQVPVVTAGQQVKP